MKQQTSHNPPTHNTVPDPAFIARLPKAELHLHLEGTITPETWLALIRRHEPARLVTLDDLQARLNYRDISDFFDVWMQILYSLREPEDYRITAFEGARALGRQNVWYAEFHTSIAGAHHAGRLNGNEVIPAIAAGLEEARGCGGPEWRLIVDVIRDFTATGAGQVGLDLAQMQRKHGVVAIGLGGSEHLYHARTAKEVFSAAKADGFHLTAHAGEAAGPESVWQALEIGAERIGHAARAAEDPTLVTYLKTHQVPLEMCPSSNISTGAVASLESHPIDPFMKQGLRVTLNSDDPPLFRTDLCREYLLSAQTFGWNRENIVRVARNGFESAFLPDAERRAMLKRFDGFVRSHVGDEMRGETSL